MATITIDTYKFIENLRSSGMPEVQAKAITKGIQEIDLTNVATKEDILLLRKDIESVKVEIIKWLVPLLLGQAGLTAALVKLL